VTCKVCDRVIAAATPRDSVQRVVTRTQGHVAAVHADLIARLRDDAERLTARDGCYTCEACYRPRHQLARDIALVIKLLEGL